MSPLHRPRKRTALGGLVVLLALTASAVAVTNTAGGTTQAQADEVLPAFDDCDALTARMADLALPHVSERGLDTTYDDGTPTPPRRSDWRDEEGDGEALGTARDGDFPTTGAAADSSSSSRDSTAVAQQAPAAAAAADAAAGATDTGATADTAAAAADTGAAAADTGAAAADAGAAATASGGAAATTAKAPRAAAAKSAASAAGKGSVKEDALQQSAKRTGTVSTSGSTESESALSGRTSDEGGYSDPNEAVGAGATGTNLQEAEVDEPDTAKTDGKLVYSLRGGKLRIVDVSGSRPSARGSLDLRSFGIDPSDLLLDGYRVLVIGTSRKSAALGLVEVSNPDRPRLLSKETITGTLVSARLSGGTARIIVSSTPDLPFLAPGSNPSGRESALAHNEDVVRFAKAEDWLPSRTITDADGRIVAGEVPLVECADVRYPAEDSGLDMLAVQTLDLGRDDVFQAATAAAVVAAGDLVYASGERLYVATTKGGWGEEASRTGKFADARTDASVTTAIHEFDISRPDGTEYLSTGTVDGYVPGRWAMSEYQGYLRVLTTNLEPWLDNHWANGQTNSHVLTMQSRKGRLEQVGTSSGIGHNETVRSVRWFDELAVVVTFRQTDPLYILDVSSPERPKLRGKLKVPGYSAYMHPIGDHRLLGIGEDFSRWGSSLGLLFSSFDIADAENPRSVDRMNFGSGSSSIVTEDPRGFVYLPERRLAIMPASIDAFGRGTGLISVRVSPKGRLFKGAQWNEGGYDRYGYGGSVDKVLSLPGGRLAALDASGLTILDADSFDVRGATRYDGR